VNEQQYGVATDVGQALWETLNRDLVAAQREWDALFERWGVLETEINKVDERIRYLRGLIGRFASESGQLRLPIEAQEYGRFAGLPPYEAAKKLFDEQPSLSSREATDILVSAGVNFNGKSHLRLVNIARTNMLRANKGGKLKGRVRITSLRREEGEPGAFNEG
jgi:hypothetical protein